MASCRPVWALLFCFSLLIGAQQVWAQQGSSPQEVTGNPPTQAAPEGSAHQIRLDVAVTDKHGKPVSGLQQQDFAVLDNKQPQKIVFFQGPSESPAAADSATEIILVIDRVNTDFRGVAYERQQLDKFFKQNGKFAQPILIVALSDSGVQMQKTASRDGIELSATLDQTENGLRSINRSQGFYGASDRIELSLRGLSQLANYEGGRPGRKMLIWLGPGWPILSHEDLTHKQQEALFNTVASVSTALRQARITVYNATPLDTGEDPGAVLYYQAFLKPPAKVTQAQNGNLALQVLALQSGGLVLNSGSNLAGQLKTCMADADAFYTLAFDPQPVDKQNEYHALAVKTDKPGLAARTRAGYYGQP